MRESVVHSFSWEGTLQRVWEYPAEQTEDDPAGRTIVMVHGFRGDHHGLLRLVEELPGYRVILPDLPGFGQGAELPGTHDVATYARFVTACAIRLAPGARVLLGHSFGSVIAAEAAAADPQLAPELILVNPISSPALEGPSRTASWIAEAYYVAADRLPEAAGRALLSHPVIVRMMSIFMAKTRDPALRRWIHAQHAAYFSAFASRRVVLEAFRASVTGTVRDAGGNLRMPVLLVAGGDDPIGPVESQRTLAASMPDATLEVLPAVGHLIHYEKPREAAHLVDRFLREHRA